MLDQIFARLQQEQMPHVSKYALSIGRTVIKVHPDGTGALKKTASPCAMIMDRAYEGDETRELVSKLGFSPVVPPKSSRAEPWEYDNELYKKRNQLFRQAD